MTTAVPAAANRRDPVPRLKLVGDHPPGVPVGGAGGGRVGYLVFLPADVDPVALMKAHGVLPEPGALPAPGVLPAAQSRPQPHPDPVRSGDGIRIDPARRLVVVDGRELELTYLEFDLLVHLVAHPYAVHTRDALISDIWGYGRIGDGRTVDVHVARLRRKLGPAYRGRISTVRRVGYRYVPDHR